MKGNDLRLRQFSKFEYGDPLGFLEALRPLDAAVSASNLPDKIKSLRTNLLKPKRELRDAAIFCLGMSTVLGVPVRFSPVEDQDFDFATTWSSDGVRHYCPIQLKEVVSEQLNKTVSVQTVVDALAKYADSDDLTVAIKLGRNCRFEPDELKIHRKLAVGALWVFGAISEDQTQWALWGDFVRGSMDGTRFQIPR